MTEAALDRARSDRSDDGGTGDDGDLRPTLIEAVQYRFGPHTTSDDPSRYREEAEVERWREGDPIPRFEAFLLDRGLSDEEEVAAIEAEIAETPDAVVDEVEAVEPLGPDDVFEFTFDRLPPAVAAQREELRGFLERHGDGPPSA